jgi:hypothetical protein
MVLAHTKTGAVLISALTLLLPGCAVRANRLPTVKHTDVPRCRHSDRYLLRSPPALLFTRVAKIEAVKRRLMGASWEDVKLALCREAHDMDRGINGLIGIQSASVSSDAAVGPIGTGGMSEKLTAIAIRYDQ